MNLSTIAILLIAWQLLSKRTRLRLRRLKIYRSLCRTTQKYNGLRRKLSSKESSQEDKTGAIFQMMTNPAVMNFASNLFKKKDEPKSNAENEEGFKFETPSKASQDFFKPIDNIADAEIKHKLYWFYDNWYIKN